MWVDGVVVPVSTISASRVNLVLHSGIATEGRTVDVAILKNIPDVSIFSSKF